MNITAIICEYNPFHNGHALHLREARQKTAARYVVCAMSGSFTQRGEPAIVDKWTRARAALSAGADVVIELPALWALRAAPDFARGAVSLLGRLGVCTHLSFGSELALEALEDELGGGEDSDAIHAALARGESYPRAVYAASPRDALRLPNAMLGVEYLRALKACHSNMQPLAVARTAPHDGEEMGAFASASAIRDATRRGMDVAGSMPGFAHAPYLAALARQGGPAGWERLAPLALDRLRNLRPEALAGAYALGEGLENRMIKAAHSAGSIQELLGAVKCKRYTHARIGRALAHIVLEVSPSLLPTPPTYARVLGFRKESVELLGMINRASSLPLVTKLPAQIEDPMLALDVRAQELWALCCPRAQRAGMDRSHSISMI